MKAIRILALLSLVLSSGAEISEGEQDIVKSAAEEEHHDGGVSTLSNDEKHGSIKSRQEARSSDQSLGKEWLVEEYPSLEGCGDENNQHICRCAGANGRLCDPDGVLQSKQIQHVENALAAVHRSSTICKEEDTDASIEIQFALALTKKMDLTPYGPYDDRQGKAAETFARNIHDKWGVGMVTECGGTGVVIFLSTHDRAIYISRGKALEAVLTDSRVDKVIESMKPFLRENDYQRAILSAIQKLDDLIQSGKPQFWERVQDFVTDYLGLFWVMAMCAIVFFNMSAQRAERRKYALVSSHLNELDKARAEALQGQYRATSCPICLEAFQKEENEENFTKGSDGQPIKLLRCGHVFDESCWEEWVASGTGQVNKCPICKMDVGQGSGASDEDRELLLQANPREDPAEQNVLRQYNFERQFRLARLGMRYPQYIGSQQIQRWTQSTYDGTLARDPSFVQNDPSLRAAGGGNSGGMTRNGSYSGGSSGFGGGSSGGGRGGRW